MYFIGIDLAWSVKNSSGVAILEGDKSKARLLSAGVFASDQDILDHINSIVKDAPAFVSIDAPLIVSNETGRRLAEKVVGSLFRKYDAGAHPSNRPRLSQWSGTIRGEEISNLLKKNGFKHDPFIKKFEKARKFFEVYPHPSIVVLFKLDRILRYKAKPKRDYLFRWNEFKKYQTFLKNLESAIPSLNVENGILEKNVKTLKAGNLKDYEDILDSIFCAYLSYYCWHSPDRCAVLGSMKEGYILTPIFDFMKKQLKDSESQKSLAGF